MFSLSQFSLSQKSLLLPIIFSAIFSDQIYTMEIGSKDNPVYVVKKQPNTQENSSLWSAITFIAPYAIPVVLTYALQKYNEDPGIAAANKEIKKIELQTKSHPDYPAISLQNKKNKIEEKTLSLREKQVEIGVNNAQLIQHHEEKLDQFKRCNEPLTPDFCNYMANIHQKMLEKFIQQNSSQS